MADAPAPLVLQQSAARHGAYRWVEHRLFELTGAWAAGPGVPPAVRLHLFEASAQHAGHAARWYDRLPVLSGVDRSALTRPLGPVLGPLLEQLAAGAPVAGSPGDPGSGLGFVAGMYRVVLPRLLDSYHQHLARLSPVADQPSRQTVAEVVRAEQDELEAASLLLGEAQREAEEAVTAAVGAFEAALTSTAGAGAERAEDGSDGLIPWPDPRCAW